MAKANAQHQADWRARQQEREKARASAAHQAGYEAAMEHFLAFTLRDHSLQWTLGDHSFRWDHVDQSLRWDHVDHGFSFSCAEVCLVAAWLVLQDLVGAIGIHQHPDARCEAHDWRLGAEALHCARCGAELFYAGMNLNVRDYLSSWFRDCDPDEYEAFARLYRAS